MSIAVNTQNEMATASDYVDVTDNDNPQHNKSSQQHVILNDDPALEKSHEHHHGHLHHNAKVENGREEEMVYSRGTTFEPSTAPHQDPQDHALHRRIEADITKGPIDAVDPEKGDLSPIRSEDDPQTHTFSNFYRKYRIFFHLFIWLFFTGSASLFFWAHVFTRCCSKFHRIRF